MMAGQTRDLLPWEARCGCPTCKAKPGQRCITLDIRYPIGSAGYRLMLGSPTTAHKARYQLWCWLWCWLWCRSACNPIPSHQHDQHLAAQALAAASHESPGQPTS